MTQLSPTFTPSPSSTPAPAPKRLLIWDLPVRIFHMLFGLTFIGAFAIATLVDDDSPLFSAHMLLGLLMGAMVLMRVIWGVVGTRHARFSDFAHGPRAVLGYVRGVIHGKAHRYAGHNPGSSVAIFLMLALVAGLAVTGIMMGQGNDSVEDLHGVLAYALLVTAIVHVLGVALHSWRQRENITRSMIDGKKEVEPAQAIAGPRPIVGLVFLVLTGLISWHLATGFDPQTRALTLPLLGTTLQLGEVEHGHHGDTDDD